MARTPDLECMLCLQNKATKKNSHIIPKFITKSLLGQGNIKRAYTIGTNRMDKAAQFSQDTVKEDYILCDGCEQYFSVLEGYIATNLDNRLHDPKSANYFTEIGSGGISCKVCEQIDPIIFRLFIYSIIWRCTISSTEICVGFNLEDNEAEILRSILLECKQEKEQDLIADIPHQAAAFPTYPFVLLTAEEFDDQTNNTIFLNPSFKNPYDLVLNEYMLVFSFELTEEQLKFDFLNNIGKSKIKIGLFSKAGWKSVRNSMMQVIVKKASERLKAEGKVPWEDKKNK